MPSARIHVHPEKIDIVNSSGCSFKVFGSLFVLVGMFALMFAIGSREHATHHSVLERVVGSGIGLAFMLVGGLFAFGKNGIVIDGSVGTISKWSGLSSMRFETESYRFEDFSQFAIQQQGLHTYAVVIQGGTTTETLFASHSHGTVIEHAEKIGAFIPLELHDEVEST